MIDFATALYLWKAALRAEEYSPRTIEEYEYVLRRLDQRIPLLQPVAVVEPVLIEYRQELQEQLNEKKISRSVVIVAIAALRSFYRVLIEAGKYPSDPTFRLKSVGAAKGIPRPLTKDQVNRLFAAVPTNTADGLRDRCLLWLYYHSLRNSEAASLCLQDFIYSAAENTFVVRFQAKGDKTRVVVLIPDAAKDIATYCLYRYRLTEKAETPQEAVAESLAKAPRDKKWGPLFMIKGKPLSRRESNRIFNKYRDKARIGKAGPHSLRHTCATNLLNAGVDIRTVQSILGHASIRQTEMYTEVLTDTKGTAMSKLPVPNYAG